MTGRTALLSKQVANKFGGVYSKGFQKSKIFARIAKRTENFSQDLYHNMLINSDKKGHLHCICLESQTDLLQSIQTN